MLRTTTVDIKYATRSAGCFSDITCPFKDLCAHKRRLTNHCRALNEHTRIRQWSQHQMRKETRPAAIPTYCQQLLPSHSTQLLPDWHMLQAEQQMYAHSEFLLLANRPYLENCQSVPTTKGPSKLRVDLSSDRLQLPLLFGKISGHMRSLFPRQCHLT